jgi:hypothetical protein
LSAAIRLVTSGMFLAAWARAEHCHLNIVAGRLEPHMRYEPSEALCASLGRDGGLTVGVLGFGVPILRANGIAYAASWSYGLERS